MLCRRPASSETAIAAWLPCEIEGYTPSLNRRYVLQPGRIVIGGGQGTSCQRQGTAAWRHSGETNTRARQVTSCSASLLLPASRTSYRVLRRRAAGRDTHNLDERQ